MPFPVSARDESILATLAAWQRELGLDIPVATLLGDGTVRDIVAAMAGEPDFGYQ